ncbi:MAG: glycosyltransferase family 4 protein [Nanoarchaeota archaeon]
MNICYINPTNNIRRPVAELANILAKKGYFISIMFPKSKNCPTKNWVANEAIKNENIRQIPIDSWYFAPLRYGIPNFFQLIKETKKIFKNNDKVHIWEYYYPLSVLPLIYASFNKKNKNKTILTTDGFVGYSYKPKGLTLLFRLYTKLFARFLFKIPEVITTYGQAMLPYAKKAGVPMEKLKVIPTGIHLERFQNVDKRKVKELKKEFGIDDEKIILFVGMLTERKHPERVIGISQKLLKEGFDIKTLLVGDAHGKNKFKELVKDEYRGKIIFTGGRKDIPELMYLADVLLLPSEGEGLPGVVMEAMASGLPVVATKEGCTLDLIKDGKEGVLVKDNNYFVKIKEILNNKKLQKEFSEKSKIKNFDWEKIRNEYGELYQN